MVVASIVVLSQIAAALLLSWCYFGRYAVTRPPIGVFNLRDIGFMLAGIVLVPYLYLVMVVLGPLTLVQYAYWHQKYGCERTTRQYLQAELR
jgi:hypothetical protein